VKKYVYETCCTNIPTGQIPALNEMILDAHEVTYKTMLKHVRGLLDWAEQRGYSPASDLHLKDDWAVGYYKSTFAGRPCYFVRWSAIEYIWTRH
jgi:hypothetical protein